LLISPTGNTFSESDLRKIISICHSERLVLLADEVYQTNIYTDKPFISAKKVLHSMGPQYKDFELFSFHSISKGMLGGKLP
jgi:alanine transaminase